jgi:hypothetical protein
LNYLANYQCNTLPVPHGTCPMTRAEPISQTPPLTNAFLFHIILRNFRKRNSLFSNAPM